MIKVGIKGMEAAFATMDKWLNDMEAKSIHAAVTIVEVALREALVNSPQYSGDFVANWKLSINTIDVSFHSGVFPEKEYPTKVPFRLGDMPAMMYAVTSNTGKLDDARMGDKLWLSNTASHDEFYAWKIEENLVRLRPENFGGDGPLRKVKAYVKANFSTINKHNVGKLL